MPLKPNGLRAATAAAITLLCSSCASYVVPEDAPSATFVLKPNGNVTGVYLETIDETRMCSLKIDTPQLAIQGQFWANTKEPKRLEVGRRLYLMTNTTTAGIVSGSMVRYGYCASMTSFVAEPGRSYTAVHEFDRSGCRLLITDDTTGAPAASAEYHPAPEACSSLFGGRKQ